MIQSITLTQKNWRIPEVVHAVQNDTGRELKMILDDVELGQSDTASVAIHRSDDSYYTIEAERVSEENAFSADMTQALTQVGLTKCQLKVTSSSNVVSAYTFVIVVQESTDGVPEEQLGMSIDDLITAAEKVQGIGISNALKSALLKIAQKVAYIDDQGQTYYNNLLNALNPPAILVSITAEYTQSGTVYNTDSLNDLKSDLVVTANYSNGQSAVVTTYTLSGNLVAGTSTITVTFENKYTTFNVTVTQALNTYSVANTLVNASSSNSATYVTENDSYSATITANNGYSLTGASVVITMGGTDITSTAYSNGTISIASVTGNLSITVTAVAVTLSSISAVYTQSGTVYTTDTLDSLKSDLAVTATYSDSSTAVLSSADYTLSGTLTVGTSTITVSYEGKTTTFTVTVTFLDNSIYNWDFKTGIVDSKQEASATLGAGVTQSSSGLSWASAANAYAYLCNMSSYANTSYTIEVDVDSIVLSSKNYNTCFINLSNGATGAREYGIEWDYSALKWVLQFSNGNTTADHNITSSTYFNGKTVKLQMDFANSKAYLYVDGTLESTFTLPMNKSNGRNYVTLGANSQARSMQSGTLITGVRIYEGLV